jgi:hypothetical protein
MYSAARLPKHLIMGALINAIDESYPLLCP